MTVPRRDPSRRRPTIVVAGPDLERRADVVRAIEARAGRAGLSPGRVRAPSPAAGPASRGRLRSWLAVLRAVSWFARVRRRPGGAGVLVVDGSWFDLLLHPAHHGIRAGTIGGGRALAAVVPRADVVVVVDASAEPHARPGVESTDWAPWAWGHYARWLGDHVVEEPRLAEHSADALAARALGALDVSAPPDQLRWVRTPLARRDRDVRATASRQGAVALAMPVPTRPAARAALVANRYLVARGLSVPTVPPVDGLEELAARLGVEADGMASFASPAKGRVSVAVTADGRMALVLKIGAVGDAGLRREAQALARLRLGGSFTTAPLRWAGIWRGHEVVAMDALDHQGLRDVSIATIVELCVALHRAGPAGSPVTHGDLAPWNLLATSDGLAVLDWENCRFEADPMTDLAHFLVQSGARVDRPPTEVAAALTAEGSPAWRYLCAIGMPPQRAPELARRYLERPWARSTYAARVEAAIRDRP